MEQVEERIYDLVADTGFDSFCFVVEKKRFLTLLNKLEVRDNLRAINRNQTIKAYTDKKFAGEFPALQLQKHEYKVRYINFKRCGKSLTNTMLVVENSNTLNELCRKRKKGLGTYVMVVFAGLYQPSREVLPKTHKVLKAFLDRFNTWSYDLAKDVLSDEPITSSARQKEKFKEAVKSVNKGYIWGEKTTLYANKCTGDIAKVFVYDKYIKESVYHKQRLASTLRNWTRIEMRVNVRKRYSKITRESILEHNETLNNIARCYDWLYRCNKYTLESQMAYFDDGRRSFNNGLKFKEFIS